MLKKVKKVYSPYLSIYRPQVGNLISILERITGIYLIGCILLILILWQLNTYFLMNYFFYSVFFFLIKSGNFFIEVFLIFFILNLLYHIAFIPIILSKLKTLVGNINNYRNIAYKEFINKSIINLSFLWLLVFFFYLGIN